MAEVRITETMTKAPHTIGADIPLERAESLMRMHQVRHLPVLSGGQIVGIISDRDVKLAAKFDGAKDQPVSEFMTQDPFVVSTKALLHEVAEEMASRKIGSAIVTDESGSVVGIFTAVDGLRVLADYLQNERKVA